MKQIFNYYLGIVRCLVVVGAVSINPDENLDTPQIITRHGFPSETHTVQTEDGYFLSLHRIPYDPRYGPRTNLQPVLVQHGLIASSADFVIGGNSSLAFLLSRSGYDVWLGNARGNTYSNHHLNYTTLDAKFWDFSWDEMAMYDLPAAIDYIENVTGQRGNLLYVGHSMGTTMFFALMSSKPEYNQKIKAMFALAPVAYMTKVKSPIRLISPYIHDLTWLSKYLGVNQFIPDGKLTRILARYGCDIQTVMKSICTNFIFAIVGFDKVQFDMSLLPVVLSHTPAPTSFRTVVHYGQEINSKKFQGYDFGKKINLMKYGQVNPPEYNVTKITVPIGLYYGDNDWLAGPRDVTILDIQLRSVFVIYRVPLENFNHIDFLWAKDVNELLYTPMLEHMKKYSIRNIS